MSTGSSPPCSGEVSASTRTGERVFETLLDLNRQFGPSLVVVTHDLRIAERMDRVLTLEDGVLTPVTG